MDQLFYIFYVSIQLSSETNYSASYELKELISASVIKQRKIDVLDYLELSRSDWDALSASDRDSHLQYIHDDVVLNLVNSGWRVDEE